MSNKSKTKIAFIIEGVHTEPQVIKNLQNNFFSDIEIEQILLPSCTNIYALWKRLKDDEYDTDIIELVKELSSKQDKRGLKKIDNFNPEDFRKLRHRDFSEVYLFFDYDGHNDNLPNGIDHNDVLKEMLSTFDNETENGKMYISYPMVESIKCFTNMEVCHAEYQCFSKISIGREFKKNVSDITIVNNLSTLDIDMWRFILEKYINSIFCLFDIKTSLLKNEYSKTVYPATVFAYQLKKYIEPYKSIMIISAFPEFLLDYFELDILEECIAYKGLFNKTRIIENCNKITKLSEVD